MGSIITGGYGPGTSAGTTTINPNGFTSAPWFAQKVPIQFICSDVPSLSITGENSLLNNMSTYTVQTGTVGRVDMTISGQNVFRGDGEYPPFLLQLDWKCIGINDYLALCKLRPYYVTFISFRNYGYYGKLVMGGPKSNTAYAQDAVSATGYFYVILPSDTAGAQTVNRVSAPSQPSASQATGIGSIPSGQVNYYWLTVSTLLGETTPCAPVTVTASAAATATTLTWAWPTTTAKCIKASLYCNNVNDSGSALLMGDVPNGSPLGPTWTDYVGFNGIAAGVLQNPPTVNTAYRGDWMGGLWMNETP